MTAIERTAYPRLDERLSGIELVAKFELTIADRAFIARAARGPTNQLTLAMLLRARQAFGLFLAPSNISDAIRSHMAAQLGLSEATEIMRGRQVLHRYRLLIRAHLAVSAYGEAGEKIVVQTTFAAATTMSDPDDLINRAIEALIAAHIDLPAFSALDRVVNHVRAQVHRRIYSEVGERLASDQATVLDALLIVDPQTGITPFNRLKHSPGPARPSNIRDWTERLAWIDKLPDPAPVLRDITFTKLRQFAAETAALEVGELLDISSADKRRTFLLSLINQSKTRCRDELAEMFLIRVRRTQAAAKEKLADLRKRHQGLEESLIAVLSQILVTAQETDADAALGQSIKALFQKRGGVDHLSEQCATVSAWHGDNVLPLLWPIHAQTRSLLFEILDQLEIQSATQDRIHPVRAAANAAFSA